LSGFMPTSGAMMNRRTTTVTGLAASLAGLFGGKAQAQAPNAEAFAGRWGGTIGPPATGLRVVLEIDGSGPPVLVSVDQGGSRIPATGGTATTDRLDLAFASVRGRLQLSPAGDGTLTGTWSQGRSMPITLTRLAIDQAAPERPVIVRGALSDEVAAAVAASSVPAIAAAWSRGRHGAGGADPWQGVAASGLRRQRDGAPVTPADIWHVGSISKSMTGTLLARLVAQGKLAWETRVDTVFGPVIPAIHSGSKATTLHQLVTGWSGLATNPPLMEFLSYPRREADARASRQRWARLMLERAPEAAPGTSFIYPNAGFVIAAAMAETVTGASWETLMRQEVFGPLGLSSAGFGPPDSASHPSGHRRGLTRGLVAVSSSDDAADNPAAMAPAGAVHMTMADLARFGRIHAEGHAGTGDGTYLSQAAWQHLHTPAPGGDYAVGLVRRADGRLWHNGSNTMWYGELLIDPALRAGASACANAANDEAAVSAMLDAAMQEAARSDGQGGS
jgi:CubicO group peptidase (beta-lactamase class C family)